MGRDHQLKRGLEYKATKRRVGGGMKKLWAER